MFSAGQFGFSALMCVAWGTTYAMVLFLGRPPPQTIPGSGIKLLRAGLVDFSELPGSDEVGGGGGGGAGGGKKREFLSFCFFNIHDCWGWFGPLLS